MIHSLKDLSIDHHVETNTLCYLSPWICSRDQGRKSSIVNLNLHIHRPWFKHVEMSTWGSS